MRTEPCLAVHPHVWLTRYIIVVHWRRKEVVLRAMSLKWRRSRLTVLALRCLRLHINVVLSARRKLKQRNVIEGKQLVNET
jgi:hypothetical protein